MTFASLGNQLKNTLNQRFSPREIHSIHYRFLESVCNVSIAEIIANPKRPLSASEAAQIIALETKLLEGVPLQYALGNTLFYGLKLNCSPAALIPRPETEELVDWVLSNSVLSEETVMDIGTGTGCIALSLKANRNQWKVTAMDVSEEALVLAQENAEAHSLQIDWQHGDICQRSNSIAEPQYSIVVSNPPYITEQEALEMDKNVLDFEPHLALFVPNKSPLLFYIHIMDWALINMKDKGWLYFEINPTYVEEIKAAYKERGFKNIEVKKDLQGKYRMIKGQIVFLSSES